MALCKVHYSRIYPNDEDHGPRPRVKGCGTGSMVKCLRTKSLYFMHFIADKIGNNYFIIEKIPRLLKIRVGRVSGNTTLIFSWPYDT